MYPHYPDSRVPELTWNEVLMMAVQELGGFAEYARTGNPNYLAMASENRCVEFQARMAAIAKAMAIQVERIGTTQALGSFATYHVTYDQLGTDKTAIIFSTHGISPRPASALQVDLFRQGQLTAYLQHWMFSTTGIILSTPLTGGEYVVIRILSPELAAARERYDYVGESGSGSGHRVWKLADLPPDINGKTITKFPVSPSKLEIHRGLLQTSGGASPDYLLSQGLGADTQVTFTYDIPSDASLTFFVWSV